MVFSVCGWPKRLSQSTGSTIPGDASAQGVLNSGRRAFVAHRRTKCALHQFPCKVGLPLEDMARRWHLTDRVVDSATSPLGLTPIGRVEPTRKGHRTVAHLFAPVAHALRNITACVRGGVARGGIIKGCFRLPLADRFYQIIDPVYVTTPQGTHSRCQSS